MALFRNLEKNVGKTDKNIRSSIAAMLITGAFSKKVSTAGRILMLVGAGMLIATSTTGKCPTYQALGVDTRSYE